MDERADEVDRHALDGWCDSTAWLDATPFVGHTEARGSIWSRGRRYGLVFGWAAGEIMEAK